MKQAIAISILILLLITGCAKEKIPPGERSITGEERDEHGCFFLRGYRWDESVGACIIEMKLDASQREAAKIAVESIDNIKGTTILEVETLRCPGCFNVNIRLGLNSGEKDVTVRLANWEVNNEITNFEECAAEGNPIMESYPRQCNADGQTFTEVINMPLSDAMQIAEKSECSEKGTLTEDAFFNENTNTWWINLEMKPEYAKQGCSPACVVSSVSLEAEINWRCTGAMPPNPEIECNTDEDCACGTHIRTGECFTGNKDFVDTEKQCPDFCTGIAANFETRCENHICRNVNILDKETMTQELCESANGHWNECGSRCAMMNAGNPEIMCTALCEELCECGGIAGSGCPEGYTCSMPEGIADAMGYCAR